MRSLFYTRLGVAITGLLVSAWPSALQAQQPDFTFTVPVEVEHLMDEVAEVGVVCIVMAPDGAWLAYQQSDGQPASPDGSLMHTFTVQITVEPENRPRLSERPLEWRCDLSFRLGNDASWVHVPGSTSGGLESIQARPGTQPRVRVTGQVQG